MIFLNFWENACIFSRYQALNGILRLMSQQLLVLSAGVTPLQIIDEIASLDVDIPLAVMTYYNVVYRFGLERFASYLREAKISGAILPDLPLIEANSWKSAADMKNREAILFAAPTTTQEHLEEVCKETKGFVYAVGLLGTTGARKELAESENDNCKCNV